MSVKSTEQGERAPVTHALGQDYLTCTEEQEDSLSSSTSFIGKTLQKAGDEVHAGLCFLLWDVYTRIVSAALSGAKCGVEF